MMNRVYSWPIRVHLTILIALLAIPSISLIVYSGIAERHEAIADARIECLKFVNEVAGRQQAIVAGAEQLGTALSLLPPIQSRDPVATNALFSELLKENPQYANIAVCDKSGLIWASAIPFEGKVSVADRKFVREAARTGMFSSGEYVVGRIAKKAVMSFGYPVKNAANELIAVIGIVLDLDYAQQMFEKLNLPPNSSFSLLDHQGVILLRNLNLPSSRELIGVRDTREENFTKMAGPDEGTFEAIANDGWYRLAAYKKIGLPRESKPYMYIRSSIPLSSATSKANAAMFKNLSVFVSLFLIGLFLAWFIGKRVIVNPITMLKRASEQLAAGTDTVHVSHVVKGGELGELARTFDAMAEALVQREMAKNLVEAALRESEQRWATTLASVGDAVIATDVEGKIMFMNATSEKLTGWTIGEAATKPATVVFNIINEQTRKQVESPINKVLREGMVVGLGNHTILVRKDGTEVPIDDSGAPIRDGEGKTTGVVLVFHDITDRKQAEEQLRQAEEKSRLLIKHAPSMLYEIDFRRPGFKSVNDTMCYFLGYTREELLAMNPFDLLDEAGKALFRDRIRRKLAGETVSDSVEYKSKTKDGREVYGVLNMTFTYKDGNPEGAVVIAHDITERRRMEEALRASEERLRRFYESGLLGVIYWNMNGEITDANDKFLEIVGYDREDLAAGRIDWGRMTPPEYRHLDENSAAELKATGVNKRPFEKEYIRKDGRRIPIIVAGAMLDEARFNGVAFVLDIAERKQAEAQVGRSQKTFSELIERAPFGIYTIDSQFRIAQMNVGSQNGAFQNVRPVIGRDFSEAMRILWPEPVAAEIIGRFRHTLETGEPYYSARFINPRHDVATVESYEWELHRMTLPDGEYGVICYYFDSTKLREAEEALQQRTLELQHLTESLEERVKERTAELANLSSQLVSAQEDERRRVSYDLHDNAWQALVAIRFEIERLFSGQNDWAALQDKSKKVMTAVLDTVGKIRSMQGDLWPYVLDDIGILATIDWYCREFEKNHSDIAVERKDDVTEDEIPLPAKIVIYRILQETLSNVAKHGQASRVSLRLMKKDHRMEFTVGDNGIGFDLEETIVKRSPWGGLGLLNIKARTELSGGLFRVESVTGKGTMVRASWPLLKMA